MNSSSERRARAGQDQYGGERDIIDRHIVDMARHLKGSGNIVRFIEFMDVGATNGWKTDNVMPSAEVVRAINEVFACEPANPNYYGEVAKRWSYKDGSGEFGVISGVTEAFCGSCTRARLSNDGVVYTCLFAARIGRNYRRSPVS